MAVPKPSLSSAVALPPSPAACALRWSTAVWLDFYLPAATTPVSCDVDKVGGIVSQIGLEQLLTQLIASRRKVLEAAARIGLCK